MKRAEDVITFKEFKQRFNDNVLPEIQKNIKNNLQNKEWELCKKYQFKFWMLILGSLLFFLSMIILSILFINFKLWKNSSYLKYFLLSLTILFLIGGITTSVLANKFNNLKKSKIYNLSDNIKKILEDIHIFEPTIKCLNKKWDFLGKWHTPTNTNISFDFNNFRFYDNAYLFYKPKEIAESPILNYRSSLETMIVDDKYPIYFSNVTYEYEPLIKSIVSDSLSSKGNKIWHATLMQIDISNLQKNKRTDFNLFKTISQFAYKPISLENKEFNKVFNVVSNDELKMNMIFTPLVQENLLTLYNENLKLNNLNEKNIYFTAVDDVITISFISSLNFLKIKLPKKIKSPENLINKTIDNILKDAYLLYFVISLFYVPVYLY
ncbi:DUF3137 domain-containing protein [[Mycoplasma] falconis]|uniref:DUF3137 domain-containing protein n=1 Tax=[Mycoplasma] falconis TaxID=92403 RepID=A0A501XAE5_9BACT|nr:DUF3137 domain-containing protein [[Mycoplasma] falconis]TPE57545.1 DUF3137 domain-containing protein [[Mycoplasma] falconis]